MTAIAIGFCLFIVGLGLLGLLSPPRFLDFVRSLTSLQGFYMIAVLRIAFGATLYLASADSRAPLFLRVLGIVLIVSGIVTPLFSHTRYRQIVEWWSAGGTLYIRVWAACVILFALLLAFALTPQESGP